MLLSGEASDYTGSPSTSPQTLGHRDCVLTLPCLPIVPRLLPQGSAGAVACQWVEYKDIEQPNRGCP